MNTRDSRTILRFPFPTLRTLTTVVLSCLLVATVVGCSSSSGEKREKRSIRSTTARPGPAPRTEKLVQPKWIEPTGAVDRASLNLKRGQSAHLTVTAATFGGAEMVSPLREQLVKTIEKSSVFGEIHVAGNQGHIAVDVEVVDTRDTEILFGTLKGRARLKVRVTIINTRTSRRLSPEDPANLFYGNIKEVSGEIAEYIAG